MRLTYALLACADDEGRLYGATGPFWSRRSDYQRRLYAVDGRVQHIAFSPVDPMLGPFLTVVQQGVGGADFLEREVDDDGESFYRIVGYEQFDEHIKSEALAFTHERDREVEAPGRARCYLNVPYESKDAVRRIGFMWDPGVKAWWYPTEPSSMYLDILERFPLLDPQPHESSWGGSWDALTNESVESTRT